jgi:glucose/arabinose dehydrogenase
MTTTGARSTTTRRAAAAALLAILSLTAVAPATTAADPGRGARPTTDRAVSEVEPQALASGQLTTKRVVGGFSSPLGVVNAGDGTGRLFVVQRGGLVRTVAGNSITGTFLNASSVVEAGGERGLLGVAFHPDFETNREVYIYYTRPGGDIIVSRLTANAGGTSASIASEEKLLQIEHSQYANHNGGAMAFGPDGYLYIGTGDGGGGGDPLDNGQDITDELLGKILRIDVDGTGDGPFGRYANPVSNPFVGVTGDDEIWAYGLRNPWRMSFDRVTGDLWIGDVGQNRWEEVNREPAGSAGGNNYGWNVMEGKTCYPSGNPCSFGDLPEAVYATALGCAITGGYVYRGPSQRDMQGLYVLGDYCSGVISTMTTTGTTITQRRDTSLLISSFGESESGELYLTDLGGTLHRVIAPEFSDIASSTFIDDIHWLLYEGITGGCGGTRFCPRNPVSRVQMAQFLDRALGLPDTATDYFSDDDGITGEASINRLAESGITGGCAPDRYCPSDPVTREQMAIFLDRALGLPATSTDYFSDDTGRTGEAAINRLAAAGLTGGCGGGKYCPTASVTREQMAAFLRRAFSTT